MKKIFINQKLLFTFAISATLTLLLTGCSDDKPKHSTTTPAAKADHNPNPWDHSGEEKVTVSQKEHFESTFASQCIEREAHNADSNDDKERFSKPCHCVANFLSKDLTAQEAEKFLDEHENPQSLRIKYENAAYHCLQEKAPPHEPDFSHPK